MDGRESAAAAGVDHCNASVSGRALLRWPCSHRRPRRKELATALPPLSMLLGIWITLFALLDPA